MMTGLLVQPAGRPSDHGDPLKRRGSNCGTCRGHALPALILPREGPCLVRSGCFCLREV